jgi:dTDP-4-dehydrorhamnose 3,5-epimerase
VQVASLKVSGAWVFEPVVIEDSRGFFFENFRSDAVSEILGREFMVRQINHSTSSAGVVRGLHFSTHPPHQMKFVSCVRGSVLDFVVDLRAESETFGVADSVVLSDADNRSILIGEGIGHGFLALEDNSVVRYVCDEFFNAENDGSINPMDPELNLNLAPSLSRLGLDSPIQSERDSSSPTLRRAMSLGILPKL